MDSNRHWRDRFAQQRPSEIGRGAMPDIASPLRRDEPPDDDEREIDLSEYKPWVLQRGRGRPALMLNLRRFDAKAAMWTGWAIAYPQLAAVEYVGDRMLSLDFGPRKFVLEGEGLAELVDRLQQGAVLAIQEYCDRLWPRQPVGAFVSAIRLAGMAQGVPPRV